MRARASFVIATSLALAGCSASASVRVRVLVPGEDCARDFGSSTAAAKIETYLLASDALRRTTDEIVADLEAQCHAGLVEAGVREPGPAAVETGARESACSTLAQWIEGETTAIASAPTLVAGDAMCAPSQIDFAGCISRCELRYRPEDVHVVVEDSQLLTAPGMSPRCRASCQTLSAIEAACTSRATPLGEAAASDDAPRSARLLRVLAHAVRAIDLGDRGHRVALAAERLVAIAPVLPEAAATVSIRAVACVSAAAEPVRSAADRLEAADLDVAPLRSLIR